jgi:hypothetical protein
MTRSHSASSGISGIAVGLALLSVLAYRPEWIGAAMTAYFRFWVETVAPLVVGHLM